MRNSALRGIRMPARRTPAIFLISTLAAVALGAAPMVSVNDQAVQNDAVVISQIVSDGPGWIVIHIEKGGGPGPVIGYAPVVSGVNKNVTVKIDSYSGTPTLFAMLHKDVGKVGTYEFPGVDAPVMANGVMVSPAFKVTGLDMRVVVMGQAVVNGTVTIAEVLSNGPGWLVIHSDSYGSPGPVIGYAAVPDGLSRNLAVTIDRSQATPTLYAMLHVDLGKVGSYEFPGPDLPAMQDGQMVSPPFVLK